MTGPSGALRSDHRKPIVIRDGRQDCAGPNVLSFHLPPARPCRASVTLSFKKALDLDLASMLHDVAMSNPHGSWRRVGVPTTVHSSAAADDRLAGGRRREQPPISPPSAGGTALAVEARGVRKSFGDQLVLDGIDLEVPEGAVFALLGPNGSGKTTTVRILSTLLGADAGTVRVAGCDVVTEADSVRAVIGVTGQFSAVDGLLSGRENLELMADLNHLERRAGRQRIAELLERFDLADAAGKPARTYSGGMRCPRRPGVRPAVPGLRPSLRLGPRRPPPRRARRRRRRLDGKTSPQRPATIRYRDLHHQHVALSRGSHRVASVGSPRRAVPRPT